MTLAGWVWRAPAATAGVHPRKPGWRPTGSASVRARLFQRCLPEPVEGALLRVFSIPAASNPDPSTQGPALEGPSETS
eukprot:CAMPEP_0196578522 /NCGR_PEP_ID=MMETSP1081-20130531/7414_1 /TAXON_ID=36882 /ORGANISM="Pyramimonas amylifera, Strain CCMP720" /LENGTH=77 /DNA_ID=CAMNT_0041897775 /DNA_START=20 /DNA_END=251 /DNA_ORIENTATION=-